MAKKAENKVPTPEHESEEWVRVDSNGNPLADQASSAEEIAAHLAAANRTRKRGTGCNYKPDLPCHNKRACQLFFR